MCVCPSAEWLCGCCRRVSVLLWKWEFASAFHCVLWRGHDNYFSSGIWTYTQPRLACLLLTSLLAQTITRRRERDNWEREWKWKKDVTWMLDVQQIKKGSAISSHPVMMQSVFKKREFKQFMDLRRIDALDKQPELTSTACTRRHPNCDQLEPFGPTPARLEWAN